MTTATADKLSWAGSRFVPMRDAERELARQFRVIQGPTDAPVHRARMSNLVVYADSIDQARELNDEFRTVIEEHPARIILLIAEPGDSDDVLMAAVSVRGQLIERDRMIFSEQVTVHAVGESEVSRLPFAVRTLLVGDLPTNLWWASNVPPALAGPLLAELAENAQQVIFDSNGWRDPARGVAATAAWLSTCDRITGCDKGRWRVASDLNWRRLKFWRRAVSTALSPQVTPGALECVTEVLVEHGPHAVVQAWELVSWLAARLGWKVQAGRVQPNVEIDWHLSAPHGRVLVRVRRLADGPSEVRRVRVAWGKPGAGGGAYLFTIDDGQHLAVAPEDNPEAKRTVTVQPSPVSALVARQLSDRDRDPVYRESMGVAQQFAASLLAR